MPHKEERKFSCICFGYLTCYEEEIGSTAYWQHKGAHTLLGCAVGAAKAGDCQSGAAGAVIGEIVAEELANTSLANNLLSPDAKKQANAKKTISTISQITSLFSASEAGLDFKTAQQTAKNAAENNALDLTHLHSIQSLKVLVALNTYLVDQGKDNNSFVIRDAGGASFVIDGKSYSLTDGILVGNRSSTSHHNLNKEGGNNSAGGDISMSRSTEITQEELVNALEVLGIGKQTLDFSIDRDQTGRSRIGCLTCVENSQIIYGYKNKHLHFGSPNLSNGVQEYVDKIGNNSFLEAGSENNNQYNMFNADGVGFFKEKNWLDPSKYYGDSWSIPTRQNFNSQQDIKNLLTTPKGEKTQQHQSQLNFQNKFFVDPANNYQASPNKK